jgi:hypothetical protein
MHGLHKQQWANVSDAAPFGLAVMYGNFQKNGGEMGKGSRGQNAGLGFKTQVL